MSVLRELFSLAQQLDSAPNYEDLPREIRRQAEVVSGISASSMLAVIQPSRIDGRNFYEPFRRSLSYRLGERIGFVAGSTGRLSAEDRLRRACEIAHLDLPASLVKSHGAQSRFVAAAEEAAAIDLLREHDPEAYQEALTVAERIRGDRYTDSAAQLFESAARGPARPDAPDPEAPLEELLQYARVLARVSLARTALEDRYRAVYESSVRDQVINGVELGQAVRSTNAQLREEIERLERSGRSFRAEQMRHILTSILDASSWRHLRMLASPIQDLNDANRESEDDLPLLSR